MISIKHLRSSIGTKKTISFKLFPSSLKVKRHKISYCKHKLSIQKWQLKPTKKWEQGMF